ncbi:ceramide kinase-like isoform X2 [Triticum dicoccoides]|uniref:ceramide kinase-like isoform X2 n=1 Tax=Triticum dicoccoides TaxID=85692 RepID=UPI00189139AA|nr:ceramide kinase-like isoform X2 [Triticum dicoccoides]
MQGDGEVLFLGGVGEVTVTLGHDGLSFLPLHPELGSSCLSSIGLLPKLENKIKFSDVYAVELLDEGPVCGPWNTRIVVQSKKNSEMHRFAVHVITRSRKHPSQLVPYEYLFGHKDPETCKSWVEHLSACINNEQDRPKNLMVFVHPLCGKGRGCKNWEMVAPLFDRAKVNTKVIITERAGHAYDTLASISDKELKKFDGVVAVGGDGLFNEILNGLLNLRNKTSYPPTPEGFGYFGSTEKCQEYRNDGLNNSTPTSDAVKNVMLRVGSNKSDDHEPLLSTGQSVGLDISSLNPNTESSTGDQVPSVSFPNDWFRLGIIPSGSTDAIVLSTTGERDAVTSALLIIFGRRIALDIAQVVRWKSSPSAEVLPTVRYAASFAGYGFYGEVIRESENYRWMGPARYDFSGTMVFLKHRSYDAKVAFLENENSHSLAASAENVADEVQPLQSRRKRSRKTICLANCSVCKETSTPGQNSEDEIPNSSQTIHDNPKWIWSEGRFLSVGAAVISCRNERAPDGLVAEAHLSDGFLHLLLIRDCPLPLYLWHLTQFTKKGSDPLTFKFVEHHKTQAFTFISSHDESVWNLDGELFQACEVSVQACRGLVNLFASGPEV